MSQQERWQLGGNAPEVYERYLVPAIFGPWAPIVIAQAELQAGERVLDVACGTGVVARLAAQHVGTSGHVTGLDINPRMLAVARSLAPAQGATVEWREGDAVALPLAEETFDVAFSQLGLQYFADRLQALRAVTRGWWSLRDALWSWCGGPLSIAQALRRWRQPSTSTSVQRRGQ